MTYLFSKSDADLQIPQHIHGKSIEILRSKTSIVESHKLFELSLKQKIKEACSRMCVLTHRNSNPWEICP